MIDKEQFERLITDKPKEIKAKAVLLYNGMAQGAKAYQDDPTSARLRDWHAAEKALDEFLDVISNTSRSERAFRSIQAVVDYLSGQGWKISVRTGYNHKKKGLLRPRKDGKFYQSDVDDYARTGILQRLDGEDLDSSDIDAERKRRAEADNAEYVARINKTKAEALEGRYIERYEYERSLSQRAILFKNDIESFIRGTASEMMNLIGGDPLKVPALIEFMLDQFEQCLGRYAEDREFKITSEMIDYIKKDEEDKDNE